MSCVSLNLVIQALPYSLGSYAASMERNVKILLWKISSPLSWCLIAKITDLNMPRNIFFYKPKLNLSC